MTSDTEKNIPTDKKAVHRKPYQSPKLSGFGAVTQLTQTNANMMKADGGPMGMDMTS